MGGTDPVVSDEAVLRVLLGRECAPQERAQVDAIVESLIETTRRDRRWFRFFGRQGLADCGCPSRIDGAPPALHICRTCGYEGGYDSVHGACAGCAYLAEGRSP